MNKEENEAKLKKALYRKSSAEKGMAIWSKGIAIYTDFIDNSAGVDCSDHEVNIKILLNEILVNGDLTEKQRNKLLLDMTEGVSDLVLKNKK